MVGRFKSIIRLTLGLVGLTASLLLAAQLFGLIPDETQTVLDGRRKFAEALAVQVSTQADEITLPSLQALLEAVVERNDDILSAGFRDGADNLVVAAGDHVREWHTPKEGRSTPDDVQVPILRGDMRIGTIELAYEKIPGFSNWDPRHNATLLLVIFMSVAGFLGYFLVLRRSLKALDPNAVIPERVRAALDALVEGVIILDEKEQIVLANKSFADRLNVAATELIGHNVSGFNWRTVQTGGAASELPWRIAMQTGQAQTAIPLSLRSAAGEVRNYMVNGTPILEGNNQVRGVLATFDDVTALEQRHTDLQRALVKLKDSQSEIERQNVELRFLATRDPLTGCLNRRAFFESFEQLFAAARNESTPLSCVMLDIDHFKSINDRYGHATGDKVIAYVAEVLRDGAGDQDLICRYGGEEFCVVIPETTAEDAWQKIDALRQKIATGSTSLFTGGAHITASAGIASLPGGAEDPATIINQADTALYSAKQGGRNRVIRWRDGEVMKSDAAAKTVAAGTDTDVTTRAVQAITAASTIDEITGLPSRALFLDRVSQVLSRAARRQGIAAILYIDVGLYQRVQETLGPAAGDDLVKAVAERLSTLLRRSDTVALLGTTAKPATCSRLGSDEFAIVLDDLERIEPITWIIQRIFDALAAPLEVGGQEIFITCGIGASLYPNDGDSVEVLLSHASAARRHARQRLGPNSFAFYTKEMTEQSYAQIRLENELRRAIDRGEFTLHYQPKVSLGTGEIAGLEALVRWQHPERGLVGPAEFIPLAEQTGLIEAIGDLVIRKACRQAVQWREIGLDPGRVAVNLSPVQLRSTSIVEHVQGILESTGLEARFLELEVTETSLVDDLPRATSLLRSLRNLGIHISLDDFGTGYSSLSYLRQLPVDRLKIDGSFIHDMTTDKEGTALVSAVIAMAQHLGIRVVAEAVETREQLAQLRNLDCDEVQGYLISKPLPVNEMTDMLRSGRPWRFVIDEGRRDDASHVATGTFPRPGTVVPLPAAPARVDG
jgi:diguanylate cyclase (GGDEF)-like protein/PAS domain S-box-containing protein